MKTTKIGVVLTAALMVAAMLPTLAWHGATGSKPAISIQSATPKFTPSVPDNPKANRPQYKITVTQGKEKLGEIVLQLFPDIAPKHVANFEELVKSGAYNGTAFHRVIPGFMIQGGDPNSKDKPRTTWGMGDPSQKTVPAEFNNISHVRGILSAARTNDPNSATSQFFICVGNPSHLNGQYTVYGQVLQGIEVVDKIVNAERDGNNNPLEKISMKIEKLKKKLPVK